MRSQQEKSQSFWPFVSNKTKRFGKAKTSVQLAHSLGLGAPTVRRDVRAGDDARVPRPRREGGAAQAEVRAQGVGGLGDARGARCARPLREVPVRRHLPVQRQHPRRAARRLAGGSARDPRGRILRGHGDGAARAAHAALARASRGPRDPESARVASRANGAHASGGRNLDAALAASPPRETPGSRIRAAAAVALTPDSKYRARVMGESAVTPAEASPGARRGTDREGGDDGDDGGSPLGPESSLGGSRLARRGSSRSPASRLPSPPPRAGLSATCLTRPSAASPPPSSRRPRRRAATRRRRARRRGRARAATWRAS